MSIDPAQLARIEQKLDRVLSLLQAAPGMKRGTVKQTDEQWLAEQRALACYTHIKWEDELLKMQEWCKTNGRHMTRRFIQNWLNKIQAPVQVTVQPKLPPAMRMVPTTSKTEAKKQFEPPPPEVKARLERMLGKDFMRMP